MSFSGLAAGLSPARDRCAIAAQSGNCESRVAVSPQRWLAFGSAAHVAADYRRSRVFCLLSPLAITRVTRTPHGPRSAARTVSGPTLLFRGIDLPTAGVLELIAVPSRSGAGRQPPLGTYTEFTAALRANVHPHRQEHPRHLPGLHRQERHLPFTGRDRLRHQDGRRHRAGQRRPDPSRPAGVRHRGRGEGENRRDRERDLRAAARRRGRDRGSDRRGDCADRLHHRRHSGRRHGEGEALALGLEVAPRRTELPGRDDGGRMQDRHHAGQHLQARQSGNRVALRHAHLRGRVSDLARRARPDHRARHRRRSREGHGLHRRPRDCSSPTRRRNAL